MISCRPPLFHKRWFEPTIIDETFVRVGGRWMYLFRAVDSAGQTVDFYLSESRDCEAAKLFLKRALANTDNEPPRVFARDGVCSYPAAVSDCNRKVTSIAASNNAQSDPVTTALNRITVT